MLVILYVETGHQSHDGNGMLHCQQLPVLPEKIEFVVNFLHLY